MASNARGCQPPALFALPIQSIFPARASKTALPLHSNLPAATNPVEPELGWEEQVMPVRIALAAAIGLISVPVIWMFLGPLAAYNLQIWQCFLAWGCFYHCGGKTDGVKTTIICMVFGACIGALVVVSAPYLAFMGTFAVPAAGAIGAAVIVLAAYIPFLSAIPASVYGFASIASFILLKGAAPIDALLPTVGSIVIGAVVGWTSERAGMLLAKAT